MALMGRCGMRQVAELCLQKARYAAERLPLAFEKPTFKEFVVRAADGKVEERLEEARQAGIFAGVPLGRWYDELADCLLVAVTEKRTKDEIDRLVKHLM